MGAVEKSFAKERAEYVILATAKVGGIYANNTYRADFLYENLAIQNAVIYNAYKHWREKAAFPRKLHVSTPSLPQPIVDTCPAHERARELRLTSLTQSLKSLAEALRELRAAVWLQLHQCHAY